MDRDFSDLPATGGVYAIENLTTGKLYVGSSIAIRRRVRDHFYRLAKGQHSNPYLQRAYLKDGADVFTVIVLEDLPGADQADLLAAEQRWLDGFSPTVPAAGYNIHPTAASTDVIRLASGAVSDRIRSRLAARRRGQPTPEGQESRRRKLRARWEAPGEKEYFSETMRDLWKSDDHRAGVRSGVDRHFADPDNLAKARARADQARQAEGRLEAMKSAWHRRHNARLAALKEAWFQRHGSTMFQSEKEMCDWIAEQYRSGTSARQIGLELGMAHSSVCRRLRDLGIDRPPRGAGRAAPRQREAQLRKVGIQDVSQFDADVCQLYEAGHSMNEISELFGVSGWAIRSLLTKAGRAIRPRGEAQATRNRRMTAETAIS